MPHKDPIKRQEYMKVYNKKWRDNNLEYYKQWRNKNKNKVREYHLQGRYGIGHEDFESMLKVQNGLCAICKIKDGTHIDHDHLSGQVRGILCNDCNRGLGNFKDNLDIIGRASFYLGIR